MGLAALGGLACGLHDFGGFIQRFLKPASLGALLRFGQAGRYLALLRATPAVAGIVVDQAASQRIARHRLEFTVQRRIDAVTAGIGLIAKAFDGILARHLSRSEERRVGK